MSEFAAGIMWCKVLAQMLYKQADKMETREAEIGFRLACHEMLVAMESQLEDLANQEKPDE